MLFHLGELETLSLDQFCPEFFLFYYTHLYLISYWSKLLSEEKRQAENTTFTDCKKQFSCCNLCKTVTILNAWISTMILNYYVWKLIENRSLCWKCFRQFSKWKWQFWRNVSAFGSQFSFLFHETFPQLYNIFCPLGCTVFHFIIICTDVLRNLSCILWWTVQTTQS